MTILLASQKSAIVSPHYFFMMKSSKSLLSKVSTGNVSMSFMRI